MCAIKASLALLALTTAALGLPYEHGKTHGYEVKVPDTYQYYDQRPGYSYGGYDGYDYANPNTGYVGYGEQHHSHNHGHGHEHEHGHEHGQGDYGRNFGYDNGNYGGGEYHQHNSGYGG